MPTLTFDASTKTWTWSGFQPQTSRDWNHDTEEGPKVWGYELNYPRQDGYPGYNTQSIASDAGSGSYTWSSMQLGTYTITVKRYADTTDYWGGSTSRGYSGEEASLVVTVGSNTTPVSIATNMANGVSACSIQIATSSPSIEPIQFSATLNGVSSTTIQIVVSDAVPLLAYGSATGVTQTTSSILVVSSNLTISGGQNAILLNGNPVQNADVIAVHQDTLESFLTKSLVDGSFLINVTKTGIYHVLCAYKDGLGNSYTSKVQPYVEVS